MKNKGFTLVELLAVIAILAILVIIALPNVLKMFNDAKKNSFLIEAKTVYSEAPNKYISERMKGNKLTYISSEDDTKLDMTGKSLKYCVLLNADGSVKSMKVSNGEWIAELSGNKKITDLKSTDLKNGNLDNEECGPKKPKTFKEDSWDTIANAVRTGQTSKYNIGDTKEVDLGTYGKHTVRIANMSTPSECSQEGFSKSACGFVVEFTDIITKHIMNPSGEYKGTTYNSGWNKDGWPKSQMKTFIDNDIYNSLPQELKSVIITTETAGYILRFGLSNGLDMMLHVIKLRGFLAPGGHVAWAAIEGAALMYVKGFDKLDKKHLNDKRFLLICLIPILLHGIWSKLPIAHFHIFSKLPHLCM